MDCASVEKDDGAGRGCCVAKEGRESLRCPMLVRCNCQMVVPGPLNLRTFKETECGSFKVSAAAVEVVRWCAITIFYFHFQSTKTSDIYTEA